ncbi:MAG: DUF5710 domain-containing protein [Methylobacter sp.]|nr:DUF5710 domain-containing protein [Methylobacter sp.]
MPSIIAFLLKKFDLVCNAAFMTGKIGANAPHLMRLVALTMIYNTAIHPIKPPPLYYKMADSKIYLNVPFAQKDEAKALGARWDAIQKKWFVPADKDIVLFARWQAESGTVESPGSKTSPAKVSSSSRKTAAGVKTHATVKDFIAYNGDTPPWH